MKLIKSTCDNPDDVKKNDAISIWNILDEDSNGSIQTANFKIILHGSKYRKIIDDLSWATPFFKDIRNLLREKDKNFS